MGLLVLMISSLTNLYYNPRGGGSTENSALDNNRPSLRWMMQEAVIAGIYEGPSRHKYSPSKHPGDVNISLTLPWWILEILPIKRLTYQDEDNMTWWCMIFVRVCGFSCVDLNVHQATRGTSSSNRRGSTHSQNCQKAWPN